MFANRSMRCIAAVLGIAAVMGGVECFHHSFTVLNQEYLHWLEVSSIYSTTGSQKAWMTELAIEGLVFCTIGLFLLWYAVHPVSRATSSIRWAASTFGRKHQAAIPESTIIDAP